MDAGGYFATSGLDVVALIALAINSVNGSVAGLGGATISFGPSAAGAARGSENQGLAQFVRDAIPDPSRDHELFCSTDPWG